MWRTDPCYAFNGGFTFVVALIICAWFSRKWGALGLAVANLAAYGIHLLTVSLYTYRYVLRRRSH